MKLLIGIIAIVFVALAVIVALIVSVVSSVTGAFVSDEFDEYHYHPDNDL